MGSQQPFPLSKLLFMSVKTLAGPLSRKFLHRAKTDTLFRKLIVLPPAHLYHFYEAKIKFRVMNLGKVRMSAVPRLSEHLDDFGLVVALRSFYLNPSILKTLIFELIQMVTWLAISRGVKQLVDFSFN